MSNPNEHLMMTEDEFIRQIIKVHGPERAVDILALAKLTGKSRAEILEAFWETKEQVNKLFYGL